MMTTHEFERRQFTIIANVPLPFWAALSAYAWDVGHSSGYEEVLGVLGELVQKLSPCIREYAELLQRGDNV